MADEQFHFADNKWDVTKNNNNKNKKQKEKIKKHTITKHKNTKSLKKQWIQIVVENKTKKQNKNVHVACMY